MAITRTEQPVRIPADRDLLDGDLVVPEGARAIVLFAHGSGSSRHSSRNRFVAGELQRTGLGTLLMDLLTADEERRDVITAEYRFNIELLARRLTAAIDWLAREPSTAPLGVGLFGASTGAAAALIAAAERPDRVRAVVSRGGRPDLACEALPRVAVPALLIVGGRDEPVISLNKDAYARLHCEKRLEIIAGATHLFEEPGALENVAQLARDWFLTHAAGCYS